MAITLEDLPFDVFVIISRKLHERDLVNLAHTSKTVFEKIQSEVYRTVDVLSTIHSHSDVTHSRLMKSLVIEGQLQLPFDGMHQYIRSLTFRTIPHTHMSLPWTDGRDVADAATRRALKNFEFWQLENELINILEQLPDDKLHFFGWHVGCDLPTGLFNGNGYLAQHQRQLQALSVKVDPGYSFASNFDGLVRLRNLRHFTWDGADFVDSYVFAEVLLRNTRHLESVNLGFQYNGQITGALEKALRSTCLFVQSDGPPMKRFTALQNISLRNISLQTTFSILTPNFDFSQLRSLKLRDCRYVLNFLRGARLHGTAINLKALDIDYDAPEPGNTEFTDESQAGGLAPEFVRFLQGFKGLEELCYRAMEYSSASIDQAPAGINYHADTLKRLVCHYHDKLALGPGKDCPLVFPEGLSSIFQATRLESVGLSILPCDLIPAINNTATAQSIKLLHLRITGQYYAPRNLLHKLKIARLQKACVPGFLRRPQRNRPFCVPPMPSNYQYRMNLIEAQRRMRRLLNMMELLNFVRWAFSPLGMPNLQILAYGDFSHKKFAWSQLVFVRYPRPNVCVPAAQTDPSGVFGESLPFRLMHTEDMYLFDEIDGSREFLKACPVHVDNDIYVDRLVVDHLEEEESYFSDSEMEGGEEMDEAETWAEFERDFFF